MEHLWSPWRLQYVTGGTPAGDCVFCAAAVEPAPPTMVVHRGTTAYVILNLYPYSNGHLMVVPVRHIATLGEASPDQLQELMQLTQQAERVLREAYQPDGLNVGINIGRAAGAGVADHLHVHLVPRWNGDANFMTTVGQTRVLPETLADSAVRLRPLFASAARAR